MGQRSGLLERLSDWAVVLGAGERERLVTELKQPLSQPEAE
jgi:hypothetical protein